MNTLVLKNILKTFDKKKGKSQITNGDIQLEDFELQDIIGQGAFGKVRIIEQRNTKKVFALKYINKQECIKSGTLRNIFRERMIIQELDHVFILNLRYAFQDEENLFFVMDWAKGGDLDFNLKRTQVLSLHTIRIYAAEIASALHYLHSHSIIHRDMKPDNLLLDSQGHIYITDFNCSLSLKERIPNAKAGTLEYMAPEMFTGNSYYFSVDWWSLGVILFQCAFHKGPFKEKTPEATIDSIKNKPIDIPNNDYGDQFISLLKCLLNRDVTSRICSGSEGLGFPTEFKSHLFFESLNWELLYKKEIDTGYIPAKTCNYDHASLMNEIMLSGDALSKSQKKKSLFTNKKNSGWLISRVSTCFSGRSNIKLETGMDPTLDENGNPRSREAIEKEIMEQFFTNYDFEKKQECIPVVMPSYLVNRKKISDPMKLTESKKSITGQSSANVVSLDGKEVLNPAKRMLSEKIPSRLRIGAPESPIQNRPRSSTKVFDRKLEQAPMSPLSPMINAPQFPNESHGS